MASLPKAPFISYSRISYFGHICSKLNFVLISHLTGKCATQNLTNLHNFSLDIDMLTYYGHIKEHPLFFMILA